MRKRAQKARVPAAACRRRRHAHTRVGRGGAGATAGERGDGRWHAAERQFPVSNSRFWFLVSVAGSGCGVLSIFQIYHVSFLVSRFLTRGSPAPARWKRALIINFQEHEKLNSVQLAQIPNSPEHVPSSASPRPYRIPPSYGILQGDPKGAPAESKAD